MKWLIVVHAYVETDYKTLRVSKSHPVSSFRLLKSICRQAHVKTSADNVLFTLDIR